MFPHPMFRQVPLLAVLVGSLAATGACKRTPPRPTERIAPSATPDPSQAVVASPSGPGSALPTVKTPAVSSSPSPLSSAEQQVAASYLRSLGRGRRATVAKDFTTAVSSFDEALKFRSGDPTAMAERGYARLLAKDYDGARADLTEAHHRASSPGLVAQIWYNLGLLEEATGNAVVARDRFEQAKTLRAKARLGASAGQSCPLEVERPNEPGEVFPAWHPMWLRMVEHFEKSFGVPYDGKQPQGTSDRDVRVALTGASEDNKSAWLVPLSDKDGFRSAFDVVGKLPNGKLALFVGVAEQQSSRCGTGTRGVELLLDEVPRVVIENDDVELNYMCQKQNGAVSPCSEEANETPVQGYCTLNSFSVVTKFFDLAAQRQTLTLTETGKPDGSGSVKANLMYVVQRDGVLITGGGCNGREAFEK